MRNCLVTKLKENVNNPNLVKLNEWKFTAELLNSNSYILYKYNGTVNTSVACTFGRCTDTGSYASDKSTGTSYTSDYNDNYGIKAANAPLNVKVIFDQKYNLRNFYIIGCRNFKKENIFEASKYMTEPELFGIRNCALDENIDLSEIASAINDKTHIKYLYLGGNGSTTIGLTGSLNSLVGFYNVTYLQLTNAEFPNGTIEYFLSNIYQNRTNTDNLQMGVKGTNITFNNQAPSLGNDFIAEFSDSSPYIKVYDSDETTLLGTYNGTNWTYNS